jgi:O-antigen ligase
MPLTGLVFFMAYATALVLAFARHPRFGFFAYLAVFYLDPPTRWWGAWLPNLRWSLLAAVVTLGAALLVRGPQREPAWYATTPARLLIFFAIWMWIQNIWALAPPEHLEASVLFTKYLVLFFLMYRFLETPADVRNVLLFHVMGCAYLGLLAYFAPPGGRLEGVGGPGIDEANALGMFAGTGVLCGAALMLAEQSWRRWACMAAMPFILNALIQSQSRGAMVAVAAAALVLFYLRPRQRRMAFYAFAGIGVLLFGYLAQDIFWQRMTTLRATVDDTEQLDGSAQNRVELAKAQLRMAGRYPLGAGHRGTAALSASFLDAKWLTKGPNGDQEAARSSHNTLLSALVEQGVPGVIVFAGLMLWLARMIFRLRRLAKSDTFDPRLQLYGAAAAASLVVVFVAGLFTDYIKTEVQVWMFAILASVMLVHVPATSKTTVRTAAPRTAPTPLGAHSHSGPRP